MAIVHLDTGDGGGADAAEAAAFVDGLRRRSAAALENAYAFLRAQADPWSLLRAEVLCEGRPTKDLRAALAGIQHADGGLAVGTLVSGGALGFPGVDVDRLSAEQARMLGTLEGFLLAADARSLHGDWVDRASRFLESMQDADGAFRIPSLAADGQPAGAAEQAKADVFFTGMIGGVLGRTPVSRPTALEAAGVFLGERFEPEVVEHDGYPALLAFAHFFTNVAHDDADEALQWCGRALEKGFRSRQLEAVATVRVLLTCDAQAMPGATFDVAELLTRVLEEQAGDGGFAELSVAGPASRTSPTVDGMLAIVRLCAALEG